MSPCINLLSALCMSSVRSSTCNSVICVDHFEFRKNHLLMQRSDSQRWHCASHLRRGARWAAEPCLAQEDIASFCCWWKSAESGIRGGFMSAHLGFCGSRLDTASHLQLCRHLLLMMPRLVQPWAQWLQMSFSSADL